MQLEHALSEPIFSSRPLFRSNAADQRHGAIIAEALARAGQKPTPTKVLRYALATAAETLSPAISGPKAERNVSW